jgi:Glycosyltransferase family 87
MFNITRKRVVFYSSALLISALILQVFIALRNKEIGGDFAAFYAGGKVAVKYPHSQLYNVELQDREYSILMGESLSSPVAFTPWFTIPLYAFARLPFLIALTIWTIVSLSSLIFGFWLTARSVGVPDSWYRLGVLVCVAFPPYLFYTLLNGQPSAFGFFLISLAYFLQKRGLLSLSGVVLSVLSFKPTLLVFIGPMLVFTRQWRLLMGLVIGCLTLGIISLLWAGIEGTNGYIKLLSMYSRAINSPIEIFQTHKYVDVGAAMRLLVGAQPGLRLLILLVAIPVICFIWYKLGPQPLSWALAVVCGILLNLYSPIYDCTLLIFAVLVVGVDSLANWLIASLYLVPLITVGVAKLTGVQLYTLVLIVFLIHLIRRAVPYFRSAEL